jgi:hypothetical protein
MAGSKRSCVAALAAFFLLALPASGAPVNSPLSFRLAWGYEVDDVIEQQSFQYGFPNSGQAQWIHNPTYLAASQGIDNFRCLWDADDHEGYQALGHLGGGKSTSVSSCQVADGFTSFTGDPKQIQVDVYAPSASLSVSLANSEGVSWQATPTPLGAGYEYLLCLQDQTPGPYPIVTDSNGGIGKFVTYTLSVANPTQGPIKNIDARWQVYGFQYTWTRRWDGPCPLYASYLRENR